MKNLTPVFICLTANFNWGKGSTPFEAMQNAKLLSLEVPFSLDLYLTDKPDEIAVDGMGSTHYSKGDLHFPMGELACLRERISKKEPFEFVTEMLLPDAVDIIATEMQKKDSPNIEYKKVTDKLILQIDTALLAIEDIQYSKA